LRANLPFSKNGINCLFLSMFLERKPKFRSRKLDFNRALPVYRYDEVDDFEEFEEPTRSVTRVATGVDKEEEDVRLVF
jgi:hypothetical protein